MYCRIKKKNRGLEIALETKKTLTAKKKNSLNPTSKTLKYKIKNKL